MPSAADIAPPHGADHDFPSVVHRRHRQLLGTDARSARETAPRVLLIGYNGASNTGAEALLQSDIADLRALFGSDLRMTVPTLNERNLRRYLAEAPDLTIVPIPPIFFPAIRRLVRDHDVVLLVEGSAYMDSWTSALLWLFLWATHCAAEAGKPCLAYAVDAGQLTSPLNRWLVKREGSKTDRIVARSEGAAERLRHWGVTAPIVSTADNAFTFCPDPADTDLLTQVWPEASGSVIGIAPINFHLWPVVIRPWGQRKHCYRWPYYFSHSTERDVAAIALAEGYARLADRLITDHGKSVALIAMEGLDEPFVRQVLSRMKRGDAAQIFSARHYNASQMTILLRGLDLLVTSRYHACVLSLAARVPQIAVGHDLRLKTLYAELGLNGRYFLDAGNPALLTLLNERVDELLDCPDSIREQLDEGFEEHLAKAQSNRELLSNFFATYGWEPQS